jgi:hypothetical protein
LVTVWLIALVPSTTPAISATAFSILVGCDRRDGRFARRGASYGIWSEPGGLSPLAAYGPEVAVADESMALFIPEAEGE